MEEEADNINDVEQGKPATASITQEPKQVGIIERIRRKLSPEYDVRKEHEKEYKEEYEKSRTENARELARLKAKAEFRKISRRYEEPTATPTNTQRRMSMSQAIEATSNVMGAPSRARETQEEEVPIESLSPQEIVVRREYFRNQGRRSEREGVPSLAQRPMSNTIESALTSKIAGPSINDLINTGPNVGPSPMDILAGTRSQVPSLLSGRNVSGSSIEDLFGMSNKSNKKNKTTISDVLGVK